MQALVYTFIALAAAAIGAAAYFGLTFTPAEAMLAAVVFGGWIAVQIFSTRGHQGGTTVNIRKAVIKRNHFHG